MKYAHVAAGIAVPPELRITGKIHPIESLNFAMSPRNPCLLSVPLSLLSVGGDFYSAGWRV